MASSARIRQVGTIFLPTMARCRTARGWPSSEHGFGSTLSTTITGLTVGKLYRVQFRANARVGIRQSQATESMVARTWPSTCRLWGRILHPGVQDFFVATAATAGLEIINNSGLDSTLPVDDFQIFESATIQVQNINNDGPGSLRQALAAAKASAVPNDITFAPALNGQTIELLSELVVDDTGGLLIDASALVKGLALVWPECDAAAESSARRVGAPERPRFHPWQRQCWERRSHRQPGHAGHDTLHAVGEHRL